MLERRYIFQTIMFNIYISFRECIILKNVFSCVFVYLSALCWWVSTNSCCLKQRHLSQEKKHTSEELSNLHSSSMMGFFGSWSIQKISSYLVIQAVTFLGWLSDLLERLSDLQLGDEKGTLNHLVKLTGCFWKLVKSVPSLVPANLKKGHFLVVGFPYETTFCLWPWQFIIPSWERSHIPFQVGTLARRWFAELPMLGYVFSFPGG